MANKIQMLALVIGKIETLGSLIISIVSALVLIALFRCFYKMITHRLQDKEMLGKWCELYAELGVNMSELMNLPLPQRHSEFNRIVVVPGKLSLEKVLTLVGKSIPLEYQIPGNIPVYDLGRPKGQSYCIRVRRGISPDESLKDHSARKLSGPSDDDPLVFTITLREYLLQLLYHCFQAGDMPKFQTRIEGMSRKGWDISILCAGSQCSDGTVPSVGWDSARKILVVKWHFSHERSNTLQALEVIPPKM